MCMIVVIMCACHVGPQGSKVPYIILEKKWSSIRPSAMHARSEGTRVQPSKRGRAPAALSSEDSSTVHFLATDPYLLHAHGKATDR
jgi:hypothetical protein